MSENSRLRIHAQITPEPTISPEPARTKKPHRARPEKKPREKLSFSDRLLRNSALACALLAFVLCWLPDQARTFWGC